MKQNTHKKKKTFLLSIQYSHLNLDDLVFDFIPILNWHMKNTNKAKEELLKKLAHLANKLNQKNYAESKYTENIYCIKVISKG